MYALVQPKVPLAEVPSFEGKACLNKEIILPCYVLYSF